MENNSLRNNSVLLIPQNDAEAVLIIQIATALNIKTIVSQQPHGAKLSQESDLFSDLQKAGKKFVVIVEMPGVETEAKLQEAGYEVTVIDHHRYENLDRLTNKKTSEPLPSSLEQFLEIFAITDDELVSHGFSPGLVRGVGAVDRGFIWALERDGYSEVETKAVSKYVRELSRLALHGEMGEKNEEVALKAWQERKQVGEFLLVASVDPKAEIRSLISLFSSEEFGRPVPMIIVSREGKLIYVQETPKALELFQKFGGFTFGQDRCWGYDNVAEKKKIKVSEVINSLKIDSII